MPGKQTGSIFALSRAYYNAKATLKLTLLLSTFFPNFPKLL